MTKTALVTGGGGFLGSHLCERLVENGKLTICLDNFGSGRTENLTSLRHEELFRVIEADLRNYPSLPAVDEIYHLASRASPVDFTDFPERIALTNTEGTRYLLDHATECDAKMLFASTSEVYGDPEEHPQSERYNGNVNIRGKRGCYDESKRFGETLMTVYNQKYDIDTRTVRIFNTYGPRMRVDDGRVIPNFVGQALSGENLTVHGDGTQTRTFCYVDDLIRGLDLVMNQPELSGEVVNLGSQNELPIKELAQQILELTETDSELIYTEGREDDPSRRCPDLSKAEEYIAWSPDIDLRTGLKQTVDYFETVMSSETDVCPQDQ